MLDRNRNKLTHKEWKSFWNNFSQKYCLLFLLGLVFLLLVYCWKHFVSKSDNFLPWLESVWENNLPIPFAFFIFLFIIPVIEIVGVVFKLFTKKFLPRIIAFCQSTEKKRIISRGFVRSEKLIRKILIGIVFLCWLVYAFFENIVNVESVSRWSLKISGCSVIILLLFEGICFFGWDYLRFGRRAFYKGGLHWYEDQDKYLVDGDYGFFGKIWYFACALIDEIPGLLHWLLCWLHIKKDSDTKDEKRDGNSKSIGQHFYQVYILIVYNSLVYRLFYIFIMVFVLLNIKHLLSGEIPWWSSWWNSTSRIGEFINSSTALKSFLSSPLDNLSFVLLSGLIIEKGPRKRFFESFLYGRLNMIVVVLSTIVAILLVLANVAQKELMAGLLFADALFTIVFLIEIGLKILETGRMYFFKEGSKERKFLLRLDWWNITDATVVLLSITSIFMLKDEYQLLSGMYAMIILRVVRLLKLLRLLKIFKKYLVDLFEGVRHALFRSLPIIIIFAVCLTFLGFILYLLSAQWGIGEEYFRNPITAVFSLFQLFTYDGWHQIPPEITKECIDRWGDIWWIDYVVRIGFCALVFAGGIVGVALLNSVFVDGMMLRDKSDEDRTRRLNELNRKIEEISTKLDDMEKRRLQG